jgi:hypothetical protein
MVSKTLTKKPGPPDLLDDESVWHALIINFLQAPMNYGSDVCAVRPLALAAGIDVQRAVAKVLAYYHHDASRALQ